MTGDDNTATGFHALFRNHVGHKNTATGAGALEGTINGITGFSNTATGADTLFVNTTRLRQHGHWVCCALRQHRGLQQHSQWC